MTLQASDVKPAEWLNEPVTINANGIYLGAHKVPGLIAEDSVTIKPGETDGITTITVTFLVGKGYVEDRTV